MNKNHAGRGAGQLRFVLQGLTVRRLSSQQLGSKPDTPKYDSRSGASVYCDNTSLVQIRTMNCDSVIICKN